MALLSIEERKKYFKTLGLGEYNEANIRKMQSRYMLRSSDADGIYGENSDNLLRHLMNCHLYLKPENFKPEEFRCGCNGRYCCGYPTYMKPAELMNVQSIRTHFGKPMTITCGVRCSRYNSEVGGIPNSEHKVGLAVDYYIAGVTDTQGNRQSSMEWIKDLPNHHYTYGNGRYVETANGRVSRGYVSAPGMGNAMHTDSYDGTPGPAPTPTPPGKIVVDGIIGPDSVKRAQLVFGTLQDGMVSGQRKDLIQVYFPSLIAVSYNSVRSTLVEAIQKWAGCTADSVWGKDTSAAVQRKLIAEGYDVGPWGADGIFGKSSATAFQKWLNDHDKPTPTPPKPTTGYKMIDVSEHQGKIDWAKVKADGIVGVIIRYAEDDYLDPRFAENMKGAKAAGLHVGAYIYSWAKTKAEAEDYAVRLYNACKPYNCDMPLYIDLEKKGYEQYADETAIAFLVKLDKLGCTRRGVYASLNWWNNYLKKTRSDYKNNAFWVAQYYKECQFEPKSDVGMWQYTSEGKVNGIDNNWVDMDICYVPYWEKKESVYDKICNWCKRIADSGQYGYKSFTDDPNTQICPICNSLAKKYWGWNCIGWCFASWKHGGGIPCTCNCGVIYNGLGDKYINWSDADVLASMKQRIGINEIKLIRNGNKAIPQSMLQKGDLLMFYEGNTYVHMGVYLGNGKVSDAANPSDGIRYGVPLSDFHPCLFAIRYTGK